MRVAVFGVGGVGGYFGARLAQAGQEVYFLARGEHLQMIKQNGLQVESIQGNFLIQPARATCEASEVGPVDAVLVGVKTWQVPQAAEAIRPLIGPNTLVVPLQNGVDAPTQLASVLDPLVTQQPHVIGGLCRIVSMIGAPGVIRHTGIAPYIAFNRLDGQPDCRVDRLRAAFQQAGLNVEVPEDIFTALWAKFVFIASFGGVGSVTRAPAGSLRSLPETRQMIEIAIREVEAVGRASGARLAENIAARTIALIDSLPESGTASMQRDVMEGRPSEVESQTGAVVRIGKQYGVSTPLNEFIYASLLPQELRARTKTTF